MAAIPSSESTRRKAFENLVSGTVRLGLRAVADPTDGGKATASVPPHCCLPMVCKCSSCILVCWGSSDRFELMPVAIAHAIVSLNEHASYHNVLCSSEDSSSERMGESCCIDFSG